MTPAYLIHHGYVVLFAWVAAEQLALPVPSEPVLLAAGVLAGAGLLRLPSAIAVGVAASLLSDVIWYEIGRARGSQVMRLLCRISLEPDSCVRRSCGIGAWGGQRPSLAGYVTVTGPKPGAPAAGGRSCCLSSQSRAGDALQPPLVPRFGFQAHLTRGVGRQDVAELKLTSVLMRPSLFEGGGPCDFDGHAVSAR